jgi:hypothetical protein
MKIKAQKSLQKFTVSELLKKDTITKEDFEKLSNDEQTELFELFNNKFQESKGTTKDKLLKQAWEIIPTNIKNALWEMNHNNIIAHIHNGIVQENKMPTIIHLEKATGLSRQTISKHLKEFKEHDLYKEHQAQFKILGTSILRKLFSLAMNGNVQACKIYLDAMGETNQHIRANQYIDKQQNNFNSETITGMKIINIQENLTLQEKMELLNLTENDIYEYLNKTSNDLEKEY